MSNTPTFANGTNDWMEIRRLGTLSDSAKGIGEYCKARRSATTTEKKRLCTSPCELEQLRKLQNEARGLGRRKHINRVHMLFKKKRADLIGQHNMEMGRLGRWNRKNLRKDQQPCHIA